LFNQFETPNANLQSDRRARIRKLVVT